MALVPLLIWSAIEGLACAFALRPTVSELISDLTGFTVPEIALVLLLWVFLTVLVAGSFACLQLLKDAIAAKQIGNMLQMVLVQVVVAMFEVLFLYRDAIDQTAPWLAQGGVVLGARVTLALASLTWIAVRGMTWYAFGRTGAPALLAMLHNRASRGPVP